MDPLLTVLDIGARGGPDPRWFPLGGNVTVVGVEADPEECVRLDARRFPIPTRYVNAALGATDQTTATLHVTRQPGCSSLLEPNAEFLAKFPYGDAFTVTRTISLRLTTVDTVCSQHGIRPHVVKIDTQGYELEIIRGAEAALRRIFLVELEVEFNPLYRGQPLFGDVDAALRGQGFVLLGLRRTSWRRSYPGPSAGGTVTHGDALYYRDSVLSEEESLPRFVTALEAYRQLDFVRSLGFQVQRPRVSPFVRLALRLATVFRDHRQLRALLDRARPDGARDWHDADFF